MIRRTIKSALGHLEVRRSAATSLQDIGTGVIRRALETLATDGLIVSRG